MKKLKYSFIILFLFSAISVKATDSVLVMLQQPPPFQFRIENLWKVILNNTGSQVRVYLTGSVMKGSTQIIDATTSQFTLPAGIKLVTAADLSPVDIDKHNNNDIERTLNKTGTFESGTYNICIRVKDALTNLELGSFCDDYDIINMSKMELLSPEDNDMVYFLLPSFTWLPQLPLPPGKTVSYQFQIVEVLNLQTPEYSFLSNPLYFYSEKLRTTLFQYPVAAKPLVNGRDYAWKIITFVDNDKFIESPVWKFTYKGDQKNDSLINKTFRDEFKKELSDKKMLEELMSSGSSLSGNNQRKLTEIPLPKSLSTKADYEYNDRLAVNSEMPKNFGSINVDIEGSPFNVNLYFDTKDAELKQSINSLGLSFDPSAIKDKVGLNGLNSKNYSGNGGKTSDGPLAKFFSFFDKFGLGDTYPDYTSNTLSGVKLTGANIAINPGLFYFSISGINNLDAIPGTAFSRKMLAGSIGVGGKDKSHFHITMMKAWDNVSSIDINSLVNGVTPQDNIIIGTDAAVNLLEDQLTIKTEVNGSMLTRDKTAPDLVSDQIPGFLKNFLDPKISSQFDFMYELSSKFKSKDIGTDIEASYKSVGPGYVSLGAPNIRQDVQSLKFKISNPFLKRKILASVYFKLDKNNIAKLNSTTSTSKGFGFNLKVNFTGYPYLLIDYRPNSVSNNSDNDSLNFLNNSNVLLISSGMNLINKNFINSANIVFSDISSSSNSGLNDYSILNLNLSDNFNLINVPLTLTCNVGYTKNKGIESFNSYLLDFSGSYTFFEKWTNSLGASYYKEENRNSKSTLYLNSSYTLSKFISFNVNLLKDYYKEILIQYGSINNLIIKVGITSNIN